MKIDLVGPARRGFAMGLNEAAGYGAVAVTALATGYLADAYGLRPAPFLLGLAFAALGLGLSALAVHETRDHARLEAAGHRSRADGRHDHLHQDHGPRGVHADQPSASRRSPRPARPAWSTTSTTASPGAARSCSHPRGFRGEDRHPRGALPRRLGAGQLVTGASRTGGAASGSSSAGWGCRRSPWPASRSRTRSRPGRSPRCCSAPGPAMVYPTLLAAIGDVAHPARRARSVGIYRLWRDGGFAVGALLAGVVADALGVRAAVWPSLLTAASGAVVAIRMYETRHDPGDLGQEPSDG